MFQLLFKYPLPVFTQGRLVLLSAWPAWLLALAILAAVTALGLLIRVRVRRAAAGLKGGRAWTVWALQSATLALILILLWQPAVSVSELSSHQNIIAVVVDDSHSMGIADAGGRSREDAALADLRSSVVSGLQSRFQTRFFHLDRTLGRVDNLSSTAANGPATHISEGLKQLADATADLPIGAVVLLSDGGENTQGLGVNGLSAEALAALRNRRIPVHTVGYGEERPAHDVEMEQVAVPAEAIADSRIASAISFRQFGYTGQAARITIRDGEKLVASRDIKLGPEGRIQTEPLFFPSGKAGARDLRYSVEPLAAEQSLANNSLSQPLLVSDAKRRILYIEGEPRWEYKFIRRAEDDDASVQVVSMLRTSENKIYRQGIAAPKELAEGFPTSSEDLFSYSGIIIGSVNVDYFTPLQQELLREYVDRRGGGILFLGGRSSLSDGGWASASVSELLPTSLPSGRNNFHRNPATVELTAAGVDSPITRLLDDPAKNAERWRKLTYLADFEDAGVPKPGATVLASMNVGRRKLPLLITQNYGTGRTAVLATGGTWRWQMSEALGDPAHDQFWRQLLRWLVADTPGPVTASVQARVVDDEGRIQLTAQVRDHEFKPAVNARVVAHISGTGGVNAVVELTPVQGSPGTFQTDWTADRAGSYLAEVTAQPSGAQPQELGRDVITFARHDGVAENFHTTQNRALLEQISEQTGGRYWQRTQLKDLPRTIGFSEAGISVRSIKELWDTPIVFGMLVGLPAAEWLLRRKWGVV